MTYTKMAIEFDLNAEFDLEFEGRCGQEAHEIALASILKMPIDPRHEQRSLFALPGRVHLPGLGAFDGLMWYGRHPADGDFTGGIGRCISGLTRQAREAIGERKNTGRPEQAYVQELIKRSFGLKSALPDPFTSQKDDQTSSGFFGAGLAEDGAPSQVEHYGATRGFNARVGEHN